MVLLPVEFQQGCPHFATGMSLALRCLAMEPFDEIHESASHENSSAASVDAGWVPDLAERLETLERANEALERARVLLERVNQIEGSRGKAPEV
jgi:hypothetical protein